MGLVTQAQVTEALAEQWGMPVVNLEETNIQSNVLELVPQTMAEVYRIMPVSLKNNVLTVAMADPQNVSALDDLRNFLDMKFVALCRPVRTLKPQSHGTTLIVKKASKTSSTS
jgi:type II secretory ATPase GspE/PulE/Tfp pilus assembly ATPase PilB-like protein